MRFYRTTSGAWAGTQADAGKGFETIEVPTDKPGLLDWLNANARPENAAVIITPPPAPPARQQQPSIDAGAAYLDHSIKIDELIQAASLPEAIRLFDQIAWRLDEHRRSIAAAGGTAPTA